MTLSVVTLPSGYIQVSSGTDFEWVYALNYVGLSTGSNTVYLSEGASLPVAATPYTANWEVSPIPSSGLTYHWSLQGSANGWSINGSSEVLGGRVVNIEAGADAGSSTLQVYATGLYDGVPETTATTTVNLEAVQTQGGVLTIQPINADSGQSVSLTVVGTTGAPGYSYSATFFPQGNGKDGIAAPCSPVSSSSSQVSLSCTTNFSYSNTGTASIDFSPTVVVSNGYSSSLTISASEPVTVYPSIVVSAPSLNEYANNSFQLPVSVSGGTPGYRYCIQPGPLQFLCSPSSGTLSQNYAFNLEYHSAGVYSILISVLDGSGINRTVLVNASIWWPLALTPLMATPGIVDSGGEVTLTSTLQQGGPPFSIWWNDSTGASVCQSTSVSGSGPVTCKFYPSWIGQRTVTLTVHDVAGGIQSRSTSVDVAALPAGVLIDDKAGSNVGSNAAPLVDEVGVLGYFNASFTGGAAPFNYEWTYNGTLMAQGAGSSQWFNVTHIWSTPGTYSVNFSATDTGGFEVGSTAIVIVNGPLTGVTVRAQYDLVDVGVQDNLSEIISGGAPPYTYTWNTGDGNIAVTSVGWYHHSWSAAQNYTVALKVGDGGGLMASSNITIVVNPVLAVPCTPAVDPNPTEVGVQSTFRLACVSGGTQAYTYKWVFGDGSTASTAVPWAIHTYRTPSAYYAYVTIIDAVGARADSGDLSITVDPRVAVTIPATGTYPCGSRDNLNPVDAGLADSLCAAGNGGVGSYTYDWRVGATGIVGSTVVFSAPGNYVLNVTANDSLGAYAWAEVTFTVVPPPRVTIGPDDLMLDVNQTAQFVAAGFNGTGPSANWSYAWTLKGNTVGSESVLNYTFSAPLNQSEPGTYLFELEVIDVQGGSAGGFANVTLFSDPTGTMNLQPQIVDVGEPANATITLLGGQAPYNFAWAVHTPVGWVNVSSSAGTLELPTSSPGAYSVFASVTDGSEFVSEIPSEFYTVNPTIESSLSSSTQDVGDAVLAGGSVTLTECRLQGGAGPFWFGFNTSGTTVSDWSPLANGSVCASTNATYGLPAQVWAAGAIRDSAGDVSTNIQSFEVLVPAAPPTVSSNLRNVTVETTACINATESSPYAPLSWAVSDATNLSAGTLSNGTLMLRPIHVGIFTVTAEARVKYGGFSFGAWAMTNVTIVVTAGTATGLAVQVSNSSYSAVVGSNFSISLQARDTWGNPVLDFAEAFSIQLSGTGAQAGAPAFINASGVPLAFSSNEMVVVPVSAWDNGTVELAFAQHLSGNVTYAFQGSLVPSTWPGGTEGDAVSIEWTPDLNDMHLFSPRTVVLTHSENDTLWRISDRFGNSIPGGEVYVRGTWGSYSTSVTSPIFQGQSGSSVWVNITVYGTQGGSVDVVSMSGQALLPAIEIPPAQSATAVQGPSVISGYLAVLLVIAVLVSCVLLLYLWVRRDRRPEKPSEFTEEDLERDSRVLDALVKEVGVKEEADIDQLGDAVSGYQLSKDELSLYLARLVTSGRLSSHPGEDDEPIFTLPPQGLEGRSVPTGPQGGMQTVQVDELALEEVQRRQADLERPAARSEDDPVESMSEGAEPTDSTEKETTEGGEA
jgi:hypothetical protein